MIQQIHVHSVMNNKVCMSRIEVEPLLFQSFASSNRSDRILKDCYLDYKRETLMSLKEIDLE